MLLGIGGENPRSKISDAWNDVSLILYDHKCGLDGSLIGRGGNVESNNENS